MILRINDRIINRKVQYFEEFDIELKYDAVGSTFAFKYPFDPNNKDQKDMSCVGHYHTCTVEDNNETLLTGYIISPVFNSSRQPELATLGGYSLPGFLEDCEIPLKAYPLQRDGVSLKVIAENIIKHFGLKMVIDPVAASAMDEPYQETTAKETQSVKSYFSELASQKNIIITHDEFGRLIFTKAVAKKPIFHFDGNVPTKKMVLTFDGRQMHSEITVLKQEAFDEETANESNTIKNPYVPFVYRPHVMTQTSSKDTDNLTVAKNALAKELKALVLTIDLDRYILNEKIIRPGSFITAMNPEAYLYTRENWFVESVRLKKDAEGENTTLRCVLPEVYTGATPKYIFQGINLR